MHHINKEEKPNGLHSHAWIMGVLGALIGAAILIHAPQQKAISTSFFLFAGFHIIGLVIALGSLYTIGGRKFFSRFLPKPSSEVLRFGWTAGWMGGLFIFALILLSGAILLQLSFPNLWFLSFILVGFAVLTFIGNLVMQSFLWLDNAVLPMVDLFDGDSPTILDAGTGSGRTIISLKPILKNANIIAIDKFDAEYIEDGGRELIENNLRLANLSDRVKIVQGDLTKTDLADQSIDAVISTNVFDHLGNKKQDALNEMYRILKPQGRFLMVIWIPSFASFAAANILSFFLTSKNEWRQMGQNAGFSIAQEGNINNCWFVVYKKEK